MSTQISGEARATQEWRRSAIYAHVDKGTGILASPTSPTRDPPISAWDSSIYPLH